jgi:hypothetical protein
MSAWVAVAVEASPAGVFVLMADECLALAREVHGDELAAWFARLREKATDWSSAGWAQRNSLSGAL